MAAKDAAQSVEPTLTSVTEPVLTGAGTEPLAQAPDTERNDELAALAAQAQAVTEAPTVLAGSHAAPALPRATGRLVDLGGKVEVVCVTPWAPIAGETLFKGDHALVTAKIADDSPTLARV